MGAWDCANWRRRRATYTEGTRKRRRVRNTVRKGWDKRGIGGGGGGGFKRKNQGMRGNEERSVELKKNIQGRGGKDKLKRA
jgi:hypothetical protein